MGRSTTHGQRGSSPTVEVLITPLAGGPGSVAAQRRRSLRPSERTPVLNSLLRGGHCVVTTRDRQIVSGWYRGLEVAHGERAILIETGDSMHSIPVESVLTASKTNRHTAPTPAPDGDDSSERMSVFNQLDRVSTVSTTAVERRPR